MKTRDKKSGARPRINRSGLHNISRTSITGLQCKRIGQILRNNAIHTKFTIGEPNDKYEQEADRVADEVMRMSEPKVQRQAENEDEEEEPVQTKPIAEKISPLVQRQTKPEEEEEEMGPEEETVQTKPLAENISSLIQRQEEPEEEEGTPLQKKSLRNRTIPVSSTFNEQIQSLKGGGQPLAENERSFFEPRFKTDFSAVRVHNNMQASQLARAMNARAFTLGNDVVFNQGQFSPGSRSSRSLLAHELTHVLQQKQSGQKIMMKPIIRGIDVYFTGGTLTDPQRGKYPKGKMSVYYHKGRSKRDFEEKFTVDVVGGGHKVGFTDIFFGETVKGKGNASYVGGRGAMPWAVVIKGNQTIHKGSHSTASLACVKVEDENTMKKINKHSLGKLTRIYVNYEIGMLRNLCRLRNAYRLRNRKPIASPCTSRYLGSRSAQKRKKLRKRRLRKWEKQERRTRVRYGIN